MHVIAESIIRIEELANEQPLMLSGASVEDSGHCKYCINGSNYSN